MINESDSSQADDWIPITEAGMMLKTRYLKTRDLASQGKLGEVKRTDNNRYFVRRSAIMSYLEKTPSSA